jgi:glycosyltransferase involved in cell wall biosynthesis
LIRILFLTESFHPVLGGGEQHIRALGERLVQAGMGATVVTRRGEASWAREEMLAGIRVVRVFPPGPGRTGKYAMVLPALAAVWREPHDLLVVRGTRILGLPGLLAGRLRGRPVVLQPELNGEMSGEVYLWGTPWAHGPARPLVRGGVALRNALLRDADAFVAMSRQIRDELLDAGVAGERIALIPHGVDTGRYHPADARERAELRARLRLPASALVVTYTGRLLKGKGLETLIDAFATLAAGDLRPHLLIVGSGAGQALSIEAEVKAGVEARGLGGRVTFTGRVENVEDYLRASDIFAFPSVFEALGLSLLEAAACGLACVGSRTGGIVDVIEDGASGLLVPPGDAQALAGALATLASEPDRRLGMGQRGRQVVLSRFDVEDSIDRYRSLFHELSSRAAGPPAANGRRPGVPRAPGKPYGSSGNVRG